MPDRYADLRAWGLSEGVARRVAERERVRPSGPVRDPRSEEERRAALMAEQDRLARQRPLGRLLGSLPTDAPPAAPPPPMTLASMGAAPAPTVRSRIGNALTALIDDPANYDVGGVPARGSVEPFFDLGMDALSTTVAGLTRGLRAAGMINPQLDPQEEALRLADIRQGRPMLGGAEARIGADPGMSLSSIARPMVAHAADVLANRAEPDTTGSFLADTALSVASPENWMGAGALKFAAAPIAGIKALSKAGAKQAARITALQESARLSAHGQLFDDVIGTQLIGGQRARLPKSQLLESDYRNVGALMERYPSIADDLPFLHASEVSSLSRFSPTEQGEMVRMRPEMTSSQLLQAGAKGGEVKKGWYNQSRAAVDHIYADEAARFSKLIAALSPRTSVESDALNSVTFFENWRVAGQPKDETAIQQLLDASVQKSKSGGKGVLGAWRKNTTTAMQNALDYLSGPKVQAFSQNLTTKPLMTPWGPMSPDDAYTADAWASGAHQVEQSLFGGRSQLKRLDTPEVLKFGDADTTAAYLRATADARRAGLGMAEVTGRGLPWAASEVQETKWSYFKSLYELAEKLNMSATDVVDQGLLTSAQIAGTPDFTMLGTGQYGAQIMRDPVKAARLQTLKSGTFESPTPTSPAMHQMQKEVAQIVDELIQRRRLTSDFQVGRNDRLPDYVIATSPQEAKAAQGARLPELGTRAQQAINTATTDALGRNAVAVAVHGGPSVIPAASATGVFKRERNPMAVSGAALRRDQSGALDPRAIQDQQMASRLSAGMTMQNASAWNATSFDPSLPPTVLHAAMPRRMKERELEGVIRKFSINGKSPFALVDRGSSFEILRIDGGTFTPAEKESLELYLERTKVIPKGKRKKSGDRLNPTVTFGSNIAPREAYTVMGAEAPTGSREVTQQMLGSGGVEYDALSDVQKTALNGPRIKNLADTILNQYLEASRKSGEALRPDVQNMLELIRDGGVSALRAALRDSSQVLPVLAALGISGTLLGTDTPASSAMSRPNRSQ